MCRMCHNGSSHTMVVEKKVAEKKKENDTVSSHLSKQTRCCKKCRTIFENLKHDDEKFFNYARMTYSSFEELLTLVQDIIYHSSLNYREAIGPEEILLVTLRFLATGGSYHSLGYSFRIAPSTVGLLVFETCEAIWDTLQHQRFPEFTQELWKEKARRFGELWNFKCCVGAIDGKHVRVQKPSFSGSLFLNYKNFFSIQLQAVVDGDLMFTATDVGDFGVNSDGSVFKNSTFVQCFLNNSLNLPPPKCMDVSGTKIPYCFVADEAYPLKDNLMRPYGGRNLDNPKRIFNPRLSRARKCVECAFGISTAKWKIFQRPLKLNVNNSIKVIMAACALHNFVRARDGKLKDSATSQNKISPKTPLTNIEALAQTGRASNTASQIREHFTNYFVNENLVEWINRLVSV
ncbi:protein ANTAGONIST OF LIKE HETEROCHROMATIN PROTEIN 1 [Elysia marginata]|uniref:Protein ANTAGONIST OF LIKE HETEROCHROMATIN PROTEIN 1 n=1 Tax=Elysia marginata TaxID=1093978 RepID=A0AAV4JFB5_9GAST|nr:protein ANTAGONIST OF LIKE HETEROCHROMATIN PROTEIN 1 [Elysia marginata]